MFSGGTCSRHTAGTQHRIQTDIKSSGGESSGASLCATPPSYCRHLSSFSFVIPTSPPLHFFLLTFVSCLFKNHTNKKKKLLIYVLFALDLGTLPFVIFTAGECTQDRCVPGGQPGGLQIQVSARRTASAVGEHQAVFTQCGWLMPLFSGMFPSWSSWRSPTTPTSS